MNILLDLDHTLWDTAGNAREVLLRLYALWGLEGKYAGGFPEFLDLYTAANDQLWLALQDGGITIEEIRLERFRRAVGSRLDEASTAGLARDFMSLMERAPLAMPGAADTLRKLRGDGHTISVCTNGRTATQQAKIRAAGLEPLIDNLFVSDHVGALKPQREFFLHVAHALHTTPRQCVMVGDNPLTDIGGAIGAGIPTVWYNSRHMRCHMPTERIEQLGELPELLRHMGELTIATPDDFAVVQDVAQTAFRDAYRDILGPEQMKYMLRMMYSTEALRQQWDDGHWYSVLRRQGQPTGYVSVSTESPELCHLQKIYLLPQARRQGLGRRLFNEALRLARLQNPTVRAIELNVNRRNQALDFYKAMGMSVARQVDVPIGQGFEMNDYIMRLELAAE